jgi:tRNA threonylcarbamoyladenosine biosynthesis protein TsaB
MSKILALDTASDACSVALNIAGEIHEEFALVPREHTQRLLPMVDRILTKAQLKVEDLDAIAFTRGPGSFTGVRICISVVQGLAFGANVPVIPLSTLQVMAAGARRLLPEAKEGRLLVALDARMSEVYWCAFDENDQMGQEYVISPEQLLENELLWSAVQPAMALGPGWHYETLNAIPREETQLEFYPHAYDLAALAATAFARGEWVKAEEAEPVYLRDTVSWKKREKKRK